MCGEMTCDVRGPSCLGKRMTEMMVGMQRGSGLDDRVPTAHGPDTGCSELRGCSRALKTRHATRREARNWDDPRLASKATLPASLGRSALQQVVPLSDTPHANGLPTPPPNPAAAAAGIAAYGPSPRVGRPKLGSRCKYAPPSLPPCWAY